MTNPRRKLLFVTRTSPFAGESGSGSYVFDLLTYLTEQGFRIHVVWTEPPDLIPTRGWYSPPDGKPVFTLEIVNMVKTGKCFWRPSVAWLPYKANALHFLKTQLQRMHLWKRAEPRRSPAPSSGTAWGQECTPVEVDAVQAAIARWRPDTVIANYVWMAGAVRKPGAWSPPFAVLTHDVRHRQLHLKDGRVFEVLGEHMRLEDECRMLAPSDALIAIQHIEAGVFSRLFPDKPVLTAPMSVRIHNVPATATPALLFVGSAHGPNQKGLRWFWDKVWPSIRRDIPEARLLIAGGICSSLPEQLPDGVKKLGRLADLSIAYADASVVIAPILEGSGIKIKLLEAIGFGRACVTTSVGLEGLEALRDELRVADSAQDFAKVTCELLRDPSMAARLGTALRDRARLELSPEACYGPLASMLLALGSAKKTSSILR